MKRIAAPMVGGLITSAFLTLEIIPVIVTYWRFEQLLWERLGVIDAGLLKRLRGTVVVVAVAATAIVALLISRLYMALPGPSFVLGLVTALAALIGGLMIYLLQRPAARRLIWPASS